MTITNAKQMCNFMVGDMIIAMHIVNPHRSRVIFSRGVVAFLCAAAACWLPCGAATLTITEGGNYSGSFESNDPKTPCISVDTAEPVVIDGAILRGSSNLIASHYQHAHVTIRNVKAEGSASNGRCAGRFVSLEGFDDVTIEHCRLEHTAGIYLLDYAGDHLANSSVRVRNNLVINIDGRKGDGNGGFAGGVELVQFLQLDKVRHVPGIDIGWNEIINTPGDSAVEDNISIYLSSGTPDSPICIHDNLVRGGYPAVPTSSDYSGGGIMLGDGVDKVSADGDPGYVIAENNTVMDTVNYGIAISAGHDCVIRDNRIISIGKLPDGKPIPAQNVGAYVWDSYKAGPTHFHDNSGSGNLIGWIKADGKRNDWWRPGTEKWDNNAHWADPIPADVYEQEMQRWKKKLADSGETAGPVAEATRKPSSSR